MQPQSQTMNLQSKSGANLNVVTSHGAATRPMVSAPVDASDSELNEDSLAKLPRVELQKLAKASNIKANMKSAAIISQLLDFQRQKRARAQEDDLEEGPSHKRIKTEASSNEASTSSLPRIKVSLQHTRRAAKQVQQDSNEYRRDHGRANTASDSVHSDLLSKYGVKYHTRSLEVQKGPRFPNAPSPSMTQVTPPRNPPTVFPYDKNNFSDTSSEMTEEEQRDFATPVSSRTGTPPRARVSDLKRCVAILHHIVEDNAIMMAQIADLEEKEAQLRKRTQDVRKLIAAERWRRQRMEAYFRYWQETGSTWDRTWLYGENMDGHAGPSSAPAGGPNAPVPMQNPVSSPEEVMQRRRAIVARQEAEQHELEALRMGLNSSPGAVAQSLESR